MKKQITSSFSTVVRNRFVRFALASLLVFSIAPAGAQGNRPAIPVEIKYLGLVDNLPVFQIEFTNENSEVFNVSIRDEDGNLLYTEKIKDKKFLKKFKWDKSDLGSGRLTFTLSGGKEKQSQVFEINTNIRVIEDVVVTRL